MSVPRIIQTMRDLQSSYKNLYNSQLVGKYYTPTVSVKTEGTTVPAIALPTTWTGSGTLYTNGGYQIESTMSPTSTNYLSNAFNGNDSDNGYRATGSPSTETSVTITLPEAITLVSFKSYIPDISGIDEVLIQGSTDKSTWTTLYNYSSGFDTRLTTRVLSRVGNYKYYKILFNMDVSASIQIREFQLDTYMIQSYVNAFEVPNIPNPLAVDQRILIKTPDYSMSTISINTFNGILVDVLMLPNRYYELVYDGSKYVAKEVI